MGIDGGEQLDAGDPLAGKLVPSPVGAVVGEPVHAMLEAPGGTLTSDDGRVELNVPPGALSELVDISMQVIESTAPGALSLGVRLTKPDAVTFAQPVQLTFLLTEREVAGAVPEAMGIGFQNAAGFWEEQPATYDAATRRLSASIAHFSDWSALVGVQLQPGAATVKPGANLSLRVRLCLPVDGSQRPACAPGAGTPCLVARCQDDNRPSAVSEWSVNAVPGGSGTTGRVSGSGGSGVYTAPSTVPQPSTVAVSVNYRLPPPYPQQMRVTCVSNVTIAESDEYAAAFRFTSIGGWLRDGYGEVVYARSSELPDVIRYRAVRGSFSVTIAKQDCDVLHNVTMEADTTPELVVFQSIGPMAKTHHWAASSKLTTVRLMCGNPRHAVESGEMVVLLGPSTGYSDVELLTGRAQLPLKGHVSWSMTRSKK